MKKNMKKNKVKKKLGKTHDEQIQAESNIPAPLSINSTKEENKNEKEKEIHNYNTKENPQTKMTDTVNTVPNINYNNELKVIIGSLLEEMRSLRNMVHHDITDLQKAISQQKTDISKLEKSVLESKNDIRKYLTDKVENSMQMIQLILDENKTLKRENDKLKERMSQLEKSQLENNVLISGQPEEPWETYDRTKERVLETIATSLSTLEKDAVMNIVKNTEKASCK